MTHFMSPKSSPNSNQVWEIPNSATVQQKDKYVYTFIHLKLLAFIGTPQILC